MPDLDLETRRTISNPEMVLRSGTQRDHDRVLYSTAFRRLGGVTQTATGASSLAIHNRLTHSLKVEHMGAAIYEVLARRPNPPEIDADAIRTACLAHDLGHPPFGHIAEDELNRLVHCPNHQEILSNPDSRVNGTSYDPCQNCELEDGFEGNAQSLRILTRLEAHKSDTGYGLNLTLLSLRATTKYPWLAGGNEAYPRKWGAYDCDAHILDETSEGRTKDIHAEIMDWADDIAYAVHDLEDFFRAGMIPLHEHAHRTPTYDRFWKYVTPKRNPSAVTRESWDELITLLPKSSFIGSNTDLKNLDSFRSTLIGQALDAVSVEKGKFEVDPHVKRTNSLLKELTWFHIIDHPDLSMVQHGQREVIRRLYHRFHRQLVENDKSSTHYRTAYDQYNENKMDRRMPPQMNVFPARLRRYLGLCWSQEMGGYSTRKKSVRAIVDYIASLTDTEAYHLDEVLNGASHRAGIAHGSMNRG